MASRTEFFTSDATMAKHKKFSTIVANAYPKEHFTLQASTKGLYLNYYLTVTNKHSPIRTLLFNTADLPNPFVTVTCWLNDNHPDLNEITASVKQIFQTSATTSTDASGFEHFQFSIKSATNASFSAFIDQFTRKLVTLNKHFAHSTPAKTPTPLQKAAEERKETSDATFKMCADDFTPLPSNPKQTAHIHTWSAPVKAAAPEPTPAPAPVKAAAPEPTPAPAPVKASAPEPTPTDDVQDEDEDEDDGLTTTITTDNIIYIDANGQTRVKLPFKRFVVTIGTKKVIHRINDPVVTSIHQALELYHMYDSVRS
jgi:hypothetical protein